MNDGLELAGYRAAGLGWLVLPGVATFRFEGEGPVVALPAGGSPGEIEEAWVRSVLPLVVQARGIQVLHASAIGMEDGAVAFCGRSTAGKSTLAAALRARGHEVLADDALAFRIAGGAVEALTLPFRLRPRGEGADAPRPPEAEARGEGGGSLPLAAVVVLAPSDVEGVRAHRLAAADSFGTLMPHAYCFELENGKAALIDAYLALARTVPAWRLDYQQRPDRLGALVDTLQRLLSR